MTFAEAYDLRTGIATHELQIYSRPQRVRNIAACTDLRRIPAEYMTDTGLREQDDSVGQEGKVALIGSETG